MRATRIATIVFFVVLAAGCHKKVPVTVVPSVPAPGPGPSIVPAPLPPPAEPPAVAPSLAVAPLEGADRAFAQGNYEESARGYETYLRDNPTGGLRDVALFQAGLSYALRPFPNTNWPRATTAFKQLIEECPNSPYKGAAAMILNLRTEIDQTATDNRQLNQRNKQLTTELDRLKKIDAERRKRP